MQEQRIKKQSFNQIFLQKKFSIKDIAKILNISTSCVSKWKIRVSVYDKARSGRIISALLESKSRAI